MSMFDCENCGSDRIPCYCRERAETKKAFAGWDGAMEKIAKAFAKEAAESPQFTQADLDAACDRAREEERDRCADIALDHAQRWEENDPEGVEHEVLVAVSNAIRARKV